jgi:hypothetical protein
MTAAHPGYRLRAALPEAALGSAAPRRAGSALPKVLLLRPLAALAWRPAAAPEMARSSAEVAVRERRLAGPVVSVGKAAALPLEESAASDEVEAPQQVAAAWDAEAPQRVAAWVGAAERQQAAARGAVEVPQPEAVARAWVGEEAAQRREARDVAVPPRGAVPGVRVAEPRAARPSAVRPWAVLWVFRRDQALPWPAPQPAERFARVTQCLQIAAPKVQSWQAVRDEVLS